MVGGGGPGVQTSGEPDSKLEWPGWRSTRNQHVKGKVFNFYLQALQPMADLPRGGGIKSPVRYVDVIWNPTEYICESDPI